MDDADAGDNTVAKEFRMKKYAIPAASAYRQDTQDGVGRRRDCLAKPHVCAMQGGFTRPFALCCIASLPKWRATVGMRTMQRIGGTHHADPLWPSANDTRWVR